MTSTRDMICIVRTRCVGRRKVGTGKTLTSRTDGRLVMGQRRSVESKHKGDGSKVTGPVGGTRPKQEQSCTVPSRGRWVAANQWRWTIKQDGSVGRSTGSTCGQMWKCDTVLIMAVKPYCIMFILYDNSREVRVRCVWIRNKCSMSYRQVV